MMSKYTVTLRHLLEDEVTKEKIYKALSTYPIYVSKSEEKYIPNVIPTREVLNEKILNHYKYREIGFEVVGRFIDELEIAMNEIMPYYNQLMHTLDLDYNIMYNVDYEKTIKRDLSGRVDNTSSATGSSQGTATDTSNINDNVNTENSTTSNSKVVNSKTPQDNISLANDEIDNVTYADNIDFNRTTGNDTSNSNSESNSTSTTTNSSTSSSSGTSTGENNESESITEITKGNYGQVSYQSLIKHYRELILNIEKQIINDDRIRELFMQVY